MESDRALVYPYTAMHWAMTLSYKFTHSGSTLTAPAGIYDTLTKTGSGTSATYDLVTKEQLTYHFTR